MRRSLIVDVMYRYDSYTVQSMKHNVISINTPFTHPIMLSLDYRR